MRVLIVIKSLGRGGAERLVLDQVEGGADRGLAYSVAITTRRPADLVDEARAKGIVVHDWSGPHRGSPGWVIKLRRHVLREHPQVVHAHLPLPAILARLTLRTLPARRRPLLVYTEHNRWSAYRLSTRLANRFTIRLDDVDLAVAVDTARSMRWPAREPFVIDHGIDLEETRRREARKRLRVELGVSPTDLLVGSVGNLRPKKDQRRFIEAAALLADRVEHARFALVGSGQLDHELRRRAGALGLADRFCFLGRRADAVEVMSAFDVFTLSSLHEGRPVALMEAMALGIPVVVTAVGAMPEMVRDRVEGRVVAPQSADALADAIGELLESPSLREKLGEAGRRRADTFDNRHSIGRIEKAYEGASAGR